jgi:tetratricopeptide (TPR) repeat protein
MPNSGRQLGISIAIIVIAFAAVFGLSSWLGTNRPPLPTEYADADMSVQGKDLKGYLIGAEGLVADWYWIQSLQYLGGKIVNSDAETLDVGDLRSLNPRLLYPYLDNATDLDPKFSAAYSFGAIILPAIDSSQAIKLTQKGIDNNPENWRLYQYLGYIYWKQKSFDVAAVTYEKGSKIAGSPPFMKQMAATMRSKGGSIEIARAMYQQMLDESEDEQSKRNAQLRLFQLDSDSESKAVNSLLTEMKNAGRCPANISAIFGRLKDMPLPDGGDFRVNGSNELVDPSGIPYTFDQTRCSIYLSADSKIPRSTD